MTHGVRSVRRLGCPCACIAAAALALRAATAFAAAPLPAADALARSIEAAPEVRAAIARAAEADGAAQLRELGPYEWTAGASGAQREIDGEGTFDEWELSAERPFRLPGKASLDRRVAGLQRERAAAELALARRRVAFEVLDAWFACVDAHTRAGLLERELDFVGRIADTVAARRRAGDAAELDDAVASAERSAASAASTAARIEAIGAARRLSTRLEGASCGLAEWDAPPGPRAGSPTMPDATQDAVGDPAVRVAQAGAEQAQLEAERARADRWPDPTLDVTYASERDGAERIAGLGVSVPLGRRRSAESARAAAAAQVAAAESEATIASVARERIENDTAHRRAFQTWRALAEAVASQARAADLSRRAFELGESSLAESLLVSRSALQARLAERSAALAAWHAHARSELLAREASGAAP
jgi:outer membrane protein TolC